MILSIDPGKWQIAYALWYEELDHPATHYMLETAGRVVNPASPKGTLERAEIWGQMSQGLLATLAQKEIIPTKLIVEIPSVRQRGSGKGDPNDLIDLAGVVGACVGGIQAILPETTVEWSPLPENWKGQLPKEITRQRVEAELSDFEKSRIQWSGEKHNIYDAIHLGLVYLHRKRLRASC